ncbi:MAG TPA: methyltransferase domain-containing protein [Candidatus Baltobacteraceae bacterium]|nr:methyltransferase domain-containing protein [Candidatus Baltobacteraceae bacterium]
MEAKGYKGMGMEGGIARWYAKTTRKDYAEFEKLAARLAEHLPAGASVLEVAPGPGYLSIELAKFGRYSVTGLDISETFVKIAQRNAAEAGVKIDFRRGNASAMPFADGAFDLIVCRAAFKNFSEPVKALAEMRRVLKPCGRAIIIDLRRDTPKKEIDAYVDNMHVGALNSAFIKLSFRVMLLKRAYTREEFEKFIVESGFTSYLIREENVGFEIALVK